MSRFRTNVVALGLVLAALSLMLPGATPSQGAPAAASGDPRYGIVFGNAAGGSIQQGLQAVGANTWYDFGFDSPPNPATGRISLIRPCCSPRGEPLAAIARANPGGVYMISNEPNVAGQDNQTPSEYADYLYTMANTLRGADPSAFLVGPNVLNWTDTCRNCTGYPSGQSWSDSMVTLYHQRYGALPLNAWGIHIYELDWTDMPLIDAAWDQRQLINARTWLNSRGLNLPIWITEFGIIWAYPGGMFVRQPDGIEKLVPIGAYQTAAVATYIDQMFGWLVANGPSLRIERWYLSFLVATSDNYTTVPGGIGLIQPGTLTLNQFGQQYVDWATTRSGPTVTPTPAVACTPRPRVEVTGTAIGGGRVQFTISVANTPGDRIKSLRLGAATNGTVDVGGYTGVRENMSVGLPPDTDKTTLVLRQLNGGAAATVPLIVVDSCGEWQTLIGGGPASFAGPAPGQPAATPAPAVPAAGVPAAPAASATATRVPTATATPAPVCTPRPPVQVSTSNAGSGRLLVTVQAQATAHVGLQALRFGAAPGATIEIGERAVADGNFTHALSPATARTSFTIRQAAAGTPVTVPLTVVDSCGDWPTFVGGGASAASAAPPESL